MLNIYVSKSRFLVVVNTYRRRQAATVITLRASLTLTCPDQTIDLTPIDVKVLGDVEKQHASVGVRQGVITESRRRKLNHNLNHFISP